MAIVLSMALLAMGTLSGYHRLLEQHNATDIAVLSENRFDGVRALLPPRGTIGYVSDSDTRDGYFLAQYYLAPLVVAPDAERDLVVANCASPSSIQEVALTHGLLVVRDFG